MFAKTNRQPAWRNRGYSSAAEARQERRSMYGTNSNRQRSRYHDEGLAVGFSPPTAEDMLRLSRYWATETRLHDIGDVVPVVYLGSVLEVTIKDAFANPSGEWIYGTDSYSVREISQKALVEQVLPLNYVAEQLARERTQILALKRGSRRRDTRRINQALPG
jgi:hypothetical protein